MVKLELDAGFAAAAESLAAQLLVDDPRNAYALYVEGSLAIVSGDYATAETKLSISIEQQPTAESLNNLAWLLNDTGRQAEAEPCARRAIEMDPKVHSAWDTLGLVLLRQKRIEESSAAFREALRLAPNDVCACLNVAELEVRQGHLRAARKLVRRLHARQSELVGSERDRLKIIDTASMKA